MCGMGRHLRAALRALRPGGCVALTTPNRWDARRPPSHSAADVERARGPDPYPHLRAERDGRAPPARRLRPRPYPHGLQAGLPHRRQAVAGAGRRSLSAARRQWPRRLRLAGGPMISPWLLSALRCPICVQAHPDVPALSRDGDALVCPACGARYPSTTTTWTCGLGPAHRQRDRLQRYSGRSGRSHDPRALPLRRRAACVLRLMLRPRADDALLDIGCGNGKFAVWNRDAVAHMVGLDPAARFAAGARQTVDLVQGDARALPFAPGTFSGHTRSMSSSISTSMASRGISRRCGAPWTRAAPTSASRIRASGRGSICSSIRGGARRRRSTARASLIARAIISARAITSRRWRRPPHSSRNSARRIARGTALVPQSARCHLC